MPDVVEPPLAAGERETLLAFLQRERALVLWKLDGLSDHDAARVGTGTGLTVTGIVEHLIDVERSWLRRWFGGVRGLHVGGVDPEHVAEPRHLEGARLRELLAAYAQESRRCDELIRDRTLDERDAGLTGEHSLRWILHHLIEETSRHLGHLDLLRELADGHTGDAPE